MDLLRGFRVGRWEVYPLKGEVCSGDEARHLEPKVMDVLVVLAEQAQEVVRRDELTDRVWGSRAVVSNEPLTRCIAQLRQALDDTSRTYIQTVPKIGYRLLKQIEPVAFEWTEASPAPPAELAATPGLILADTPPRARSPEFSRSWLLPLLSLFSLAAALLIYVYSQSSPSPTQSTLALAPTGGSDQNLIAILPFRVVGAVPEPEMLGDGLGIANQLYEFLGETRTFGLAQKQRVYSEAEKSRDPQRIMPAVGADYVLDGAMRLIDGDTWEIDYDLYGDSDSTLLSRTARLSENFNNLESFLVEVCLNVHRRIRENTVALPRCEGTAVEANPAAVRALTLALRAMDARDISGLHNAIGHLRDAIKLDSGYGDAYLLLARAYSLMPAYGDGYTRQQWLQAARQEIQQGLVRAAAVVEPGRHFVEAGMFYMERRLEEAYRSIEEAMNNAPADSKLFQLSDMYQIYSQILSATGHRQAAIDWAQRAVSERPDSQVANQRLGMMYTFAGDPESAEAYLDQARALGISETANLKGRIVYEMQDGDYDEAGRLLEKLLTLANHAAYPWVDSFVAYFNARKDQDPGAAALRAVAVDALSSAAEHDWVNKELLFGAWVYLEQWDRAADVATSVRPDEEFNLELLFSEAALGLRQSELFPRLLEHFRLSEFWRNTGTRPSYFCQEPGAQIVC